MRRVIVILMIIIILGQLGEARRRFRSGGRRNMDTGITKGIATMFKSMTDDDEDQQEDSLISGRDIKADVKNYKLHNTMLSDYKSVIIVTILSVLSVGIILYCLFFKSKNMETDFDYARMRELRAERERSLKLVRTIAQHGVHPERANGNIYRIRL